MCRRASPPVTWCGSDDTTLTSKRSLAGVREAFDHRRTATFYDGTLIGDVEHLRPLVGASLKVMTPRVVVSDIDLAAEMDKQIALRLGISSETVKTHLRNALTKFNLRNRSELQISFKHWDFSAWER